MRKESLKKDGNKNGVTDADAEFDALFNIADPRASGDRGRDASSATPPLGSGNGNASSAPSNNGAEVGDINNDNDDTSASADAANATTNSIVGHSLTLGSSFSSKTKAARKATHITYAEDARDSIDASDNDDDDGPTTADTTHEDGNTGDTDAKPNLSGSAGMETDGAANVSTSYEVEDIMAHKLVRKRLLFQVRWKGYAAADDTWETEAALDCPNIIERYRAEHPDAVQPVTVPKTIKTPKAPKASKSAAADTQYEVEEIVGHRIERKKNVFLIRWKGYAADQDTWEPEATLACPELLGEYKEAHSAEMAPPKEKKAPRKRASAAAADPTHDYEVRAVVGKRVVSGRVQYQVRWKNYTAASDTWETEANLNCADLIAAFEKKQSAIRPSSHRSAKDRAAAAYESESDAEVLPAKKNRRSVVGDAADESYEVERIVDVKTERGKKLYLVKWKGWPASSNTWEPLASLSCAALLKQFEEQQKSPKRAAVPTKAARKSTVPLTPRGRPAKVLSVVTSSPKRSPVKRSASKVAKTAAVTKKTPVTPRGRARKAAAPSGDVDPLASDNEDDGEDEVEWEVQKIIDVSTLRDGSRQFLIRWKGCDASGDTWEPEDNIDSPELLQAFFNKKPKTPTKSSPKKNNSKKTEAAKKKLTKSSAKKAKK